MTAIEPFVEYRQDAVADSIGNAWMPGDTGMDAEHPRDGGSASRAMAEEIDARNRRLAGEAEISDDLRFFLDELADALVDLPRGAPLRVDPYFLLSAQRALIGSLRALDLAEPADARRQMRIRLEQLRQVYRDLAEGEILYEGRPAEEIARWLAQVLAVPQARLAELVGVSSRTFQRWLSESDRVSPEGEDARRLEVIAAATNHLRHALTGPGVVGWFEAPTAELDGRRPLDLLDEPTEAPRIATLAARARSHTAA
jgi:putative toxin-antitoxin system antitoxin component (TIGR02293 family)